MKNIQFLFAQYKKVSQLLATLIAFCFLLYGIRVANTQTLMYGFLLWNLFLACLPLLLSLVIMVTLPIREHIVKLVTALFIWLLLLPNSFYLITDFEHINRFPTVPFWFDLILLSSFALTGMYAGLLSLMQIEKIICSHFSPKLKVPFVITILYLSGFGVYLGRYYRFNSWDVLQEPFALLRGILKGVTATDAQNFTVGFGTFLLVLYFVTTSFHSKVNNL